MAVDYFLKVAGADGESKVSGHEDEIDIIAWDWGMTQSGTMHRGGGGGAGKVNIQDISVTKYIDKATPTLIKMCCNGEHFDEAVLTARKAGKDPLEYLKIKMTKVLVSSIATGGSDTDDRSTENVTLNFKKFEVDYVPQKEDGSGDAEVILKWNVEGNVEE